MEEVPEFRVQIEEMASRMRDVGSDCLKAIAMGLNLVKKKLQQKFLGYFFY